MLKKVFTMLLAVLTAAEVLTGCSSGNGGSDAGSGGGDVAGSGSPTLDAILEAGTIRVGCSLNGAPVGFTDDSGNPMGYDVDWANRLGEVLGVEVEIINVDAETRIPALTSGRVDVLFANITGNLERAKSIDFSIPYLRCGIKMITAADGNAKLEAQPGLYTSDPICAAVRKGDMEFVRYLDMFVSWQISSGWQSDTYQKWWGVEPSGLNGLW